MFFFHLFWTRTWKQKDSKNLIKIKMELLSFETKNWMIEVESKKRNVIT